MFIWRVVVFYFHLKQIQPYISGGWCNDREIVLAKWHIHLNPWKPFFVWHLFPLFCCCPALECYENDGTFHSNFTFLCPVQKLSGNFARVFWKRQIHNCEICFWFTLLEPCSSTTLNRRHRQLEQQQFHADSEQRRATDLCTCSCQPLWKLFQLPTVADQPLHLFCRQYSSIKPLGLLINWIAKIAQSIFHPYSVY